MLARDEIPQYCYNRYRIDILTRVLCRIYTGLDNRHGSCVWITRDWRGSACGAAIWAIERVHELSDIRRYRGHLHRRGRQGQHAGPDIRVTAKNTRPKVSSTVTTGGAPKAGISAPTARRHGLPAWFTLILKRTRCCARLSVREAAMAIRLPAIPAVRYTMYLRAGGQSSKRPRSMAFV
jgi:hypothetical protein